MCELDPLMQKEARAYQTLRAHSIASVPRDIRHIVIAGVYEAYCVGEASEVLWTTFSSFGNFKVCGAMMPSMVLRSSNLSSYIHPRREPIYFGPYPSLSM